MKMNSMQRAAFFLGLFAIVGTAIVSLSYEFTQERIVANKKASLLKSLHAVISADRYDNEIISDIKLAHSPDLLGSDDPIEVFIARKEDKPVAAIFSTIAPDGYSGRIFLLVGVNFDGSLSGVRVVSHKETPGLGDQVDSKKSDWILGFDGLSLGNPDAKKWKVKRDGGQFDQLTGATISPRAIVKAVYNTLQYFSTNKDELFSKS